MVPIAVGHHLTGIMLFVLLTRVGLAAFVSTPTSVNATLGSIATFNCSATLGTIGWTVNDSLLTELLARKNTTDITTSSIGRVFSLLVPAREKYNNTLVRCVLVIPGTDWNYSDPAVLRVQGLLGAVCNLKSESQRQIIRLTWDAPFSLDITGVDPDIWYRVEITVGNVPLNRYDGINITEFNFTVNDTSVIYEFQVTPVNGAGNGVGNRTISTSVTGYFNCGVTILLLAVMLLVPGILYMKTKVKKAHKTSDHSKVSERKTSEDMQTKEKHVQVLEHQKAEMKVRRRKQEEGDDLSAENN